MNLENKTLEEKHIKEVCKDGNYGNPMRDKLLTIYDRREESRVRAIQAMCITCKEYPYNYQDAIRLCDYKGCPLWNWRPWQKDVYINFKGLKVKYKGNKK